MDTASINNKLKKTYLALIKGLGEVQILEIISELSLFLKKTKKEKKLDKIDYYSGCWSSEKSAEHIIKEMRDSRTFNRKIEGF